MSRNRRKHGTTSTWHTEIVKYCKIGTKRKKQHECLSEMKKIGQLYARASLQQFLCKF